MTTPEAKAHKKIDQKLEQANTIQHRADAEMLLYGCVVLGLACCSSVRQLIVSVEES